MRTRRSNRIKRYTLDTYGFLSSGDEENSQKRRKDADENDENFEARNEEQSAAEEDEDEVEVNVNESASEAEGDNSTSRQRPKPAKGFNSHTASDSAYLDIELIPPEGQHKGYVGSYERGMRGKALVRTWYGPVVERIEKAHQLLERWSGWTLLPPKVPQNEDEPTDKGFWTPAGTLKEEARLAEQWLSQVRKTLPKVDAWSPLSLEETESYRFPQLSMPVLVGPYWNQQQIPIDPDHCYAMSDRGIPFDQDDDEEKATNGWMLDMGGVVLGMDWAPRRDKNPNQILALAIIPHADQEFYNYEEESIKPNFQKFGVIQIWEFHGVKTDEEFIRASPEPAIHRKSLCLDYGRAKRVKWSPTCNHIAILCGEGDVCVVDVGDLDKEEAGAYYKLQTPLALLRLNEEYSIKATALAWVNCNRVAVGYTDGSIALWSILPQRLLSRHPVHHNHIIDMVSGYPTMPNLIASIPVGGTARLLDLQAPSYETTEVQRPLVHTQPGLLAYSDHLLGFLSIYPSASALNTIIGFLHYAHFPVARRVFTGDSFLTCLAIGRLHPFLLIGAADGSLWCLNAQTELFSNRHESTDKFRVFQHEHRPAYFYPADSPAAARGACRILHGFNLEKNRNSKPEIKSSVKKSKKLRSKEPADGMEEDEEAGDLTDPSRAVLHEALTRICAIEWNPNEDYGCWAAVAMGSGLVKIIDLGLEKAPGEK